MGKYIVAIDGGATKTDMILGTADGRVLKRSIGGSSNPSDIGFDQSVLYLRGMLSQLLEDYGGLDAPLCSFYAGLSGGGIGNNKARYFATFKDMLPNANNIFNDSDGINALNSGIGCQNGMVLIAGTGSVAFVRNNSKITQVGGWGYLLDDAGSGYDLGRRGFKAVLRDHDGRGPNTILADLYSKALKGPVHELIPEIYHKGKQFIASFAPLIFEAAVKGDKISQQILDICAEELALLAKAGSIYIKQDASQDINQEEKSSYPVVLAGGLWKSGDALISRFKSHLSEDFALIYPDLPPVYGAAIEAVTKAKTLDYNHSSFYKNFKETLK